MDLVIRLAQNEDLPAYTSLLQRTYQEAYTNIALGITKDCFSKKIFDTADTQEYLLSNLQNTSKQKSWVATIHSKLVGSVAIIEEENEYDLRGFYVDPGLQGKGIGKKLWEKVKEHGTGKDIVLDIYAHNTRSIEMYEKWGFVIDTQKGIFYRHWPEWPEGVQAKCFYMRLKQ